MAPLKIQLVGRENARATVQKNYEQHEAGVEQGYLRTVEALEKEIDRLKQVDEHYRRVGNQLQARIHEEAAQAKQIQLQQWIASYEKNKAEHEQRPELCMN